MAVLKDFGFGSLDLDENDFLKEGNIIQLGYEPVHIDIMTSIEGVSFADIWKNRVQGKYGKQTVNCINRQQLLESKKLSHRTQDKADLELLLSEKP